jgi:hypothetical protein
MNSDTITHGFDSGNVDKDTLIYSIFNNCNSNKPLKDVSEIEIVEKIKGEGQKLKVLSYRNLTPEKQKKEKSIKHQMYLGCGTIPAGKTRSNENIVLNGRFIADYDKLPDHYANWEDLKTDFSLDNYTQKVYYTIGGKGLAQEFVTNANDSKEFKEAVRSIVQYILINYGAQLDDKCFDLARPRILSYDENIYYNPDCEVYSDRIKEELKPVPVQQIDNFNLDGNTPAQAFNNDPKSIDIINELLEQQGYSVFEGKGKTLYEYQRADGSPKSIVCFNNDGVFKFHVFSSNTGLLKEVYNCYELYKELAGLTDYEASKRLSVLNFGKFIESNKNLFPIDVFPPRFRDYANDLKQTVNYPIDYTATAMLAATATAAGANLRVIVKSGWIEQGSIFCCLLGNAGANKTHPINTIFAPIKAIDKDRHDNYKFEYDIYASYDKLSKKDKEALDNVFAPILEKSVLSNFTTEILFKRLSENPRGCTVVSDELISFLEGMNNYSKSDQIGFYLSVWSNQSTTVDRVGNAIPLFISNPYLSIIGGLQPRALNKAFPPDKLNNGFFQRFLFAYPDDAKKEPLNDNVADAHLAQKYEAFMNDLFKIDEPKTLTFSPAAKAYFYEWQSNNCDQVNEHQNSIKGEILSKYDNHFIRLALLVQIMTDSSNDQIEIEAVHAAKALCEYYLNCAFKVLAKIQNKENYLLSLPQDKQQLFNGLDQQFTTAEAIAAGASLEMIERTVKNYLTDSSLFKKVKHGIYLKCQ